MRVRITRIVTWDGLAYFRVTQVGNPKNVIVTNKYLDAILLSLKNQADRYTIVNDTFNDDYIIRSKYE